MPTASVSAIHEREWLVGIDEPVLVTGANGFIGSETVKTLLEHGFRNIRCFVRPSGNLDRLQEVALGHPNGASAVRIVEGNLLDPADCARTATGAKVIFHLAAGFDKSFAGCVMNSVLTTRNLLDAAVADRSLKRFVNVSSFATEA